MHGVELRETSAKGLLWILNADEGISYGPEEPTRLVNMKVRFYDGDQEVRSTLTAKHGEVEDRTQLFSAQDSVVVITPKDEKLETESLLWDPKQERIRTDAPFKLTRGTDVMTGIGFDADPDLRRYAVHKAVRAEMRDEKNRDILNALDADSARGASPDSGGETHADSASGR